MRLLLIALAVSAVLPLFGCGGGTSCANTTCGGTCCLAGQSCVGGACCTTACGTACCQGGESCIAGACCPTPCGTACCASGSRCVADSSGNQFCAVSCTSSSQCAAGTPCCAPVTSGSGGGACVANGSTACLCTTVGECNSGCCAPAIDANGNPVGPYICKQNDGAPYHCCFGALTSCTGTNCCVTDTSGNQFCAPACTNSSTCGSGHCNTYSFAHTSCAGPTACGP